MLFLFDFTDACNAFCIRISPLFQAFVFLLPLWFDVNLVLTLYKPVYPFHDGFLRLACAARRANGYRRHRWRYRQGHAKGTREDYWAGDANVQWFASQSAICCLSVYVSPSTIFVASSFYSFLSNIRSICSLSRISFGSSFNLFYAFFPSRLHSIIMLHIWRGQLCTDLEVRDSLSYVPRS